MLPSGSGGDAVPREFQNLERLNPHIAHRPSSKNLRSKSPAETVESSSSPRSGNEDACNFDFSADQNVGKSRLCHRSRSSAIIWKPALNDGLYGKLQTAFNTDFRQSNSRIRQFPVLVRQPYNKPSIINCAYCLSYQLTTKNTMQALGFKIQINLATWN